MDLFDKIAGLPGLHEQIVAVGRDPFGVCMDKMCSATEAMIQGRNVVLAGTNNYLGLTFDQDCVDSAHDALNRLGTGTTGSRIANGTYSEHRRLEDDIASFFGFASSMVFPTGYQANLGVISALAGPGDYILLDADCHACIYDGCRMTGATVIRFRHNCPEDLDKRLKRLDSKDTNKLIIVEGLYSMFGDIAPLAEFAEIKRRHKAYLYVDEAHSVGVFGEKGRGVAEHAGVLDDVDFVVGTFSKSLGSIGGFCASDHPKFPYLRFASRPYMFTASLSPSNVASVTTALGRLRSDPGLQEALWRNAHALYDRLSALGLTLAAPPSPIIAVKIATQEQAVVYWNKLLEAGVYVNLAIPPGTPNSTSLLRCSASAAHTPAQIDRIATAFGQVAEEMHAHEAQVSDRYLLRQSAE
jgi:8-amino-7-oxononanoate synthase